MVRFGLIMANKLGVINMKISLIHPSRSRPEMAIKTAEKWLDNADNEIEYILLLDKDDYQQYVPHYQSLYQNKKHKFWVAEPKEHGSAINAINYGAEIAFRGNNGADICIVVSDDTDCFKGWDTDLIKSLEGKSDFSVKTNDGIQKTLITMPCVDREYYNRFGYIYEPAYSHMFVDQEFTAVGMMLDKVIKLDLEFKHLHYSVGGMEKDEINIKNNATWQQGERLFKERLKSNFGLKPEEIVKPYSEIVWH